MKITYSKITTPKRIVLFLAISCISNMHAMKPEPRTYIKYYPHQYLTVPTNPPVTHNAYRQQNLQKLPKNPSMKHNKKRPLYPRGLLKTPTVAPQPMRKAPQQSPHHQANNFNARLKLSKNPNKDEIRRFVNNLSNDPVSFAFTYPIASSANLIRITKETIFIEIANANDYDLKKIVQNLRQYGSLQ